jgi:hypothetical protein
MLLARKLLRNANALDGNRKICSQNFRSRISIIHASCSRALKLRFAAFTTTNFKSSHRFSALNLKSSFRPSNALKRSFTAFHGIKKFFDCVLLDLFRPGGVFIWSFVRSSRRRQAASPAARRRVFRRRVIILTAPPRRSKRFASPPSSNTVQG